MSFYAVANGKQCGIYNTWKECQENVKGYKCAKYKKFDNENDAKIFIQEFGSTQIKDKNVEPHYYVYMDGACSKNGTIEATSGIGVYFGEDDPRNISKKVDDKPTNNVAELNAMITAFNIVKNDLDEGKIITFVSDSEYAIKCATCYGKTQQSGNWAKDIPNKELVKILYEYCKNYVNLQFLHIKAHTNNDDIHSIGNHNADLLARKSIY